MSPPSVLHLVGAPSSAGAYAPGQEKAPAAFRRHGLVGALRGRGRAVHDHGDVDGFRWRPDLEHAKAMNVAAVRKVALELAERLSVPFARSEPALVLGGDCTVELGTVAAARRHSASVGLIYIDLDADLNPPDASDGALDWTGVAHLLNLPGTSPELSEIGPHSPMLRADEVLLFAADNLTAGETKTQQRLGIQRLVLAEVKRDPLAAAHHAVRWANRFDWLLVHLDVDVLEYVRFPIAENVRRADGLTLEELALILPCILAAPNWRALTLTEVNPDHAPDEAEVFQHLIAVLCEGLAPTG